MEENQGPQVGCSGRKADMEESDLDKGAVMKVVGSNQITSIY